MTCDASFLAYAMKFWTLSLYIRLEPKESIALDHSSLFCPSSPSIPEFNAMNGVGFLFVLSVSVSSPLKSLNHSASKKPSSRPFASWASWELLRISWLWYSMLLLNCAHMCVKFVHVTSYCSFMVVFHVLLLFWILILAAVSFLN